MRSKLIAGILQFPQFIDGLLIVAGNPGQRRTASVHTVMWAQIGHRVGWIRVRQRPSYVMGGEQSCVM
jgi:hypothetical protein